MSAALIDMRKMMRVTDNPLLVKAVDEQDTVVPVYVLSSELLIGRSPILGLPNSSSMRVAVLLEYCRQLKAELRDLGSDLYFRVGNPQREMAQLAKQFKAQFIYTNWGGTPQDESHLKQMKGICNTVYAIPASCLKAMPQEELGSNAHLHGEQLTYIRNSYGVPMLPPIELDSTNNDIPSHLKLEGRQLNNKEPSASVLGDMLTQLWEGRMSKVEAWNKGLLREALTYDNFAYNLADRGKLLKAVSVSPTDKQSGPVNSWILCKTKNPKVNEAMSAVRNEGYLSWSQLLCVTNHIRRTVTSPVDMWAAKEWLSIMLNGRNDPLIDLLIGTN